VQARSKVGFLLLGEEPFEAHCITTQDAAEKSMTHPDPAQPVFDDTKSRSAAQLRLEAVSAGI
jgi:hypothetical protein